MRRKKGKGFRDNTPSQADQARGRGPSIKKGYVSTAERPVVRPQDLKGSEKRHANV